MSNGLQMLKTLLRQELFRYGTKLSYEERRVSRRFFCKQFRSRGTKGEKMTKSLNGKKNSPRPGHIVIAAACSDCPN